MITLDQLVPENHLVRKVEAAIDFSFIYSLVEDAYSAKRDRPSIDPIVLIKMTFIQYMFSIHSIRKTIAKNQLNGSLPMQRKSMECGGQSLGGIEKLSMLERPVYGENIKK